MPRDGSLFIVSIFHARCRHFFQTKMADIVLFIYYNKCALLLRKLLLSIKFGYWNVRDLTEHQLFHLTNTSLSKMVHQCSLLLLALIMVYSAVLGINPSCYCRKHLEFQVIVNMKCFFLAGVGYSNSK